MKKKSIPFTPVGAGSLLAAFAIVCLSVFALLSLTTAHREQRLAHSTHQAVSAYYEADFQAQEIFARLQQGELPPQVHVSGNTYTYQILVSRHSRLEVALLGNTEDWQILRWQLVAEAFEEDRPLEVWTIQEETP